MQSVPKLPIVVGMVAIVLGLPLFLYALLTRARRRTMHEIRKSATTRGWHFRIRHWLGDPTAFRIDGQTQNGLDWTLRTRGASENNRGWTIRMGLTVPCLGGLTDFAILPRGPHEFNGGGLASMLSPALQNKVARFSGTLAGAAEFLREASEFPTGLPAFDTKYQILSRPERVCGSTIGNRISEGILEWPPDSVVPRALLIWRDPFGLHLIARLPGPPNWLTVAHFVELASDLCARIPVPEKGPAPRGFVDRLAARFLQI